MKRKMSFRGLASLLLAAALFFHALPAPARGEQLGKPAPELVSGRYLLLCGGVALGAWEDGWVTAVEADKAEPWWLTVEGENVTLTDPNGITLCPGPEGLSPGAGSWQVTVENGLFFFGAVWEETPVLLASNAYAGNRFRAYPQGAVVAEPEVYISGFSLYPVEEPPAETTAPTETAPTEPASTETVPAQTLPPETAQPPSASAEPMDAEGRLPWNIYFGRLHSHSAFSDGTEPVEDLFARAKEAGLDFYAVTDHGDSFDNDLRGSLGADGTQISQEWAAGRAAAMAATEEDFLGLYGFEMSWPRSRQLGHIATLGTPGWQSRDQEGYAENPAALTKYYDALAGVPGSVSIFCHPGEDSGDFEGFGHRTAARDERMALVEIGGEEGFDLSYYLRALEQGWHVAPSVTRHRSEEPGTARTAVLAEELTEEALLEALSNCRAYATTDSDLTVYFTLNGAPMGSVTTAAGQMTMEVVVSDPAEAGARVEVLGEKGTLLAEKTLTGNREAASFTLPATEDYCFLRVTQPDGDEAVTAPVWLTQAVDMGIEAFTADTQVPTRGKPLSLTLSLYNNETVDFCAETAVFSIDGQVIHAVNLETIPGGGTWDYTFTYTHLGLGIADIRAVVTGTVSGQPRTYEKTLTLRFRMEDTVGRILVDGSHGGSLSYGRLEEIAAEANVSVTVAETLTWEDLQDAQLLIIPAGSRALEPEFLELAAEFVKNGGSLILCGRTDKLDGSIHWSAEGNKLLKRLGSTLRLRDDTAVDEVDNGGSPEKLAVTEFNDEAALCRGLSKEQIYRQNGGSTVSGGTWLVRGFDTARSEDADGDGGGEEVVLLAMEDSRWGGKLLAAGGDFLEDTVLPALGSRWELPSMNQGILENLLDIQRAHYPLSTIRQARDSAEGEILRIKGYVTAGTSNAHTRFPELIYIQDDTGGIAVAGFRVEGIQVGTALELVGQRCTREGNPVMRVLEYRLPQERAYRHDPENSRHREAMDYEVNGGRLMQVEGVVESLIYTADGSGLTRLTLTDARGDPAVILIEPYIRSGSTGKNDLGLEIEEGVTVRARGILHLNEKGSPVLRVRNCDEVVYVPPNIIPYTGDTIGFSLAVMVLSSASLLLLRRKRKQARVGATSGRPK